MRIVRALTKYLLIAAMGWPLASLNLVAAQITLAWNANTETNLAGYKIWASSLSGLTSMNVGKATTATLTNLTAGVAYTFYATAYNTDGLESSPSPSVNFLPPSTSTPDTGTNSGSITPAVPPTITQQPAGSQVLVTGAPLTLSVGASGTAPLKYQWYRNNTPLAAGTNATYQVSSVKWTDSGSYVVTVSNSAGAATSGSAFVSVLIPPAITQQPASLSTNLGSAVYFAVNASGSSPLRYQWFRNGTPIPNATGSIFQISSVQSTDIGSYSVIVTNTAGVITSSTASLSVAGGLNPPLITQPPASQSLTLGSALNLSVVASGTSPFQYQWYRNGSLIQNATSPTFQIGSVQLGDAGSYTVTVSNSAGTTTSSPATVSLLTAPTISLQPTSQTLVQGSGLTFSVTADGSSPLQYQWFRNGSAIQNGTGSIFQIGAVQSIDAGSYTVTVSNGAGSVTSNPASVNIITPPTITQAPGSQSLAPGAALSLSCTATGLSLQYQWAKNGSTIPGATTPYYQVSAVQASDAGSYTVTVSNGAGSVTSSAATVAVLSSPSITQQPASQTLPPGASFSLSVTATGSAPLQYQWARNGSTIQGATSSTFQIAAVQSADAGSYTVTVSNSAGSTTSTPALLTVLSAPTITQQPTSQALVPGAALALSITATGSSPLQYQWAKNGSTIPGANGASFQVAAVQASDAGSYTVTVSNSAGTTTSAAAVVTVLTAPTIGQQPNSQTLLPGAALNLSVIASGSAPLQYQWARNGASIQGATSATLNISAVQAFDAGSYAVTISNAAGSVTSSAAVITVLSAPTVTQQPASQTLMAGATLNLSVGATGSAPLQYQWAKNGSVILGATSSTYQISAVQSADAGAYTVAISNAAGTTASSAASITVLTPPSITQQPSSQTLLPGANLTLSVTVTGSGPLQYQWARNGSAIPGASSSTFQVSSAQSSDSGAYTVTVSNTAGSVTSSAAAITVLTPPTITQPPISQTLLPGAALTLSVTATGSAPLQYQWARNGSALSGANSSALQIGSVQGSDAGTYTVTVSNGAGTTTSSSATITVLSAPAITQQPQSQTLVPGATFTLSVSATGSAPLQYQWARNGSIVPGATGQTFQIASVQSSDAGSYTVTVSNAAGSKTSSPAVLTVLTAPSISQQPLGTSLAPGAALNLAVTATGSAPLQYQWAKDGLVIQGATSSTLQIASVDAADAGSYTVTISNGAGTITSSAATVTVLVAPTITQQPIPQSLAPGATLSLSVSASGSAPLQYQWTRNGATIAGATNSTYQVSSVQSTDAGSYSVIVSNGAGTATSPAVPVSVIAAPAITQHPANQTLGPGATLTLAVTATGSAPLQYQWAKNGSAIAGANSSTFQISSVQASDAGTYTVSVTNPSGSVTSSGALVSIVTAPAINQPPVSQNIAAGSTLALTVSAGGSAPLQYQWMRNGVALQNATSATLQISSAKTIDSGSYSVKVFNSAGSVTSAAAIVNVLNPPVIAQQPADDSIVLGSALSLSVTATGSAPLNYQWFKNGTALSGATSSTFQIAAVQSSDAASYTVTVSNLIGQANSSSATVTVEVPPTIVQQASAQSLSPGSPLTLAVTASGSAPLHYQWALNGTALLNATNSVYQVGSVQSKDAGSYVVTVSNSAGSATSSPASVTVLAVPVITLQPISQSLPIGSALSLSVQANGSAPLKYQWLRNGSPLAGATSPSLLIDSIQSSDAGSYSVAISNDAGSTTSSAAVLTIATAPVITQQPGSQALIVGSSLNLSVGATGAAPLQYQWLKNGTAIQNATNASFQIASFQTGDAGSYQVRVSNNAGSTTSASANISLIAPPAFVSYPSSQTVAVGSPVVLSVQVTGSAPFQYQWFRNGARVPSVNSDILEIASADLSDAGSYTVRVSNAAGTSTSYPGTLTVLTPPAITSQPLSQTAALGSSVSFSASATGSSLHFQWFRDGVAIANANSSLLLIPSVQTSDAGNYSLEVSNIVGVVTSANATLATVGAPVITLQPASQTLAQGSALNLSVQVSGSAPIQFQWYRNGAALPGANASSYAVASVQPTDAGAYTVKVSNSAGSVTSSSAVLTVLVAPTILTHPATQTLPLGSGLTLSVQASGSGPLTYQWSRNGSTIAGATSATFQIASVQSSDAGSYTVAVANAAGSVTSRTAFITVLGPPTVVTQPVSQTIAVGSVLNLSVQASGSNPLNYQWYKNGSAIANATSPTYQIGSAQSADSGVYTVTVSNGAGTATSSGATVAVLTAPTIITQPVGQTLASGSSFSLSVQASGSTPLQYQWLKDGTAIRNATSATFQIGSIQSSDAGSYTVQIVNPVGSVTSRAATLTVLGAPLITSQPQSQSVLLGTAVTFSVQASGSNPLTYRWYRNGTPIANGTSATYQVNAVQASDAGSYTVTVSNGAGSIASSAAVLAVLLPPTITTQPVGQSLTIGAPLTLSVQVSGTAPFQYQWYRGGNPILGANSSSYQISALQSSDAASYTVTVSNSAGSVTSAAAVVGIVVPPTITTQPASQTLLVGNPLVLTVQASGTAPLTYQWFRSGITISGATSPTLQIPSAQALDGGSYTVKVSNPGGSVTSSAAVITVNAPPVITSQPQSQTVTAGSSFTLSATASGSAPLQYRWSLNGSAIPSANTATLLVTNAQSASAGTYTVTVSNPAGTTTSSGAVITVQAPPANTTAPVITSQPATQTLGLGGTMNLSVAFTGTAPMQIQWYHDGIAIAGANSATLQVVSLQSTDAGSYTVTLSNSAGAVTSNPAQITLLVAPSILTQPQSQAFDNGSQITLSVVATGTGPLQYQWYRNNVKLTGATAPTFSFTARSSNQGTYRVTVSNPAGTVTSVDATLTLNTTSTGAGTTKTTTTKASTATAAAEFPGRLNISRLDGAGLVLRALGTPGHVYTIQATAEIPATTWNPVASVIASETGLIELSSTPEQSSKAVFYRVIDEQPE